MSGFTLEESTPGQAEEPDLRAVPCAPAAAGVNLSATKVLFSLPQSQ